MKQKTLPQFFIHTLLVSCISLASTNGYAGGGHDHHAAEEQHQDEIPKGLHGGRLLQAGNFSLELTIAEVGIEPEMRVYAYQDGQPVSAAAKLELEVELQRLGGERETIGFQAENDYRLGDQTIREPHSYEVTVNATYQGNPYRWHFDNFEGRTHINERLQQAAGIISETAQAQTLNATLELFGVISAPDDSVFRINAPYEGLVNNIHVQVGDEVKKGQLLATLFNSKTLQSYSIKSPSNGMVTERFANQGDRATANTLLEISDFSRVWVDMSAFPEGIEKLRLGQTVAVRDLHEHEQALGEISYIAPQMTGGHIARTRAAIANPNGHWRPGMHVKAEIQIEQKSVPLAVKTSALQSFRDMPVVFAKYGDAFEVRMVELGESDGDFIEVKSGLKAGTQYVTENSFLLKADVLKDGASHDH